MVKFLNRDKEARARLAAGANASEDKVLEEYKKLAGAFDVYEAEVIAKPKAKRKEKKTNKSKK